MLRRGKLRALGFLGFLGFLVESACLPVKDNSGGDLGVALDLSLAADGSRSLAWRSLSPAVTTDLHGVWAGADGVIWTVGMGGVVLRCVIERCERINGLPTSDLYSVWGSGPLSVHAVGANGRTLYFDGSWRAISNPTSYALRAVRDNMAVGDSGLVLEWQNSKWSTTSYSGSLGFVGVNQTGTTRMAIGGGGYAVCPSGANWSVSDINLPISSVRGVFSADGALTWLVGAAGLIASGSPCSGSVSKVGALTQASLNAIWGAANEDLWVVGDAGSMLHYNGATWSPQSSPTSSTLRAIWGSGPEEIWAVGDAGTVLRYSR